MAYALTAQNRGRLALASWALLSVTGVTSIVTLFMADSPPQFPTTAYAALSEVEDAPIEDGADVRPGVIHRARDGLFYATMMVNDQPVRCIVDTGASATVLSAADSHRLGLPDGLHPNGHLHTVGGVRPAARSHLDEVDVAGHSFRHVPAVVVLGASTPCLLGQDLLARLDVTQFRGDELILR